MSKIMTYLSKILLFDRKSAIFVSKICFLCQKYAIFVSKICFFDVKIMPFLCQKYVIFIIKYYHISQKLSSLSKGLTFFSITKKIILSQQCYSELKFSFTNSIITLKF